LKFIFPGQFFGLFNQQAIEIGIRNSERLHHWKHVPDTLPHECPILEGNG
jgi:hypothetical protein